MEYAPGSKLTKYITEECVTNLERIFVFKEPDDAGAAFAKSVKRRLKKLGW